MDLDADIKDNKSILVEDGTITELSDEELDWWREKAIKPFRDKLVKKPLFYVDKAISELHVSEDVVRNDVNDSIRRIREKAWGYYIKDEIKFHNEVLSHLVNTRKIPGKILKDLTDLQFGDVSTEQDMVSELHKKLPNFVGDFIGRSMPYIYPLALSTTNSRRNRSGTTFEIIISKMFQFLNIPYQDQSMLGQQFFTNNNVSKKVDFIIPSKDEFTQNRSRTMILSTKTSLRERWQEVVEELRRTGNANIHLLTVDEGLSMNIVTVMNEYNIILVVYDEIKNSKFGLASNVIGYTELFNREIPHVLAYWGTTIGENNSNEP